MEIKTYRFIVLCNHSSARSFLNIQQPLPVHHSNGMVTDSFRAVNENCEKSYNDGKNSVIVPYTWKHMWRSLIWKNFIFLVLMNVSFFGSLIMYTLGVYLEPLKRLTIAWIFIFGFGISFGITAGAHRLWSHRAYKAKLPLQILLMIFHSATGQYSAYDWAKDHRVHHRYSETDADPYNAKRGFMFSHIGWLYMKRHPECLRRGREVDISDIRANVVVMFQKKNMMLLVVLLCFVLPTLVPILFWEETILNAFLSQCIIRYVTWLHVAWCINSFAHMFGDRPYNKFINAADSSILSLFASGEGSHNYHHTFPWDYKGSELPYMNFNTTTLFLQAMAKIGWAYDLREPSSEQVQRVIERVGWKSEVKGHYF